MSDKLIECHLCGHVHEAADMIECDFCHDPACPDCVGNTDDGRAQCDGCFESREFDHPEPMLNR